MFSDELVIIGVHSAKFTTEGQTEAIRQAVMRHGIRHPVVNDAGFKTWNAYAVRAWPTLVLIDPRGRIAGEVSGEIQAEEFAENIREVIVQHEAEIDRTPLALRPEAAVEPERPLRFPSRLLISGSTLFIADTGHHRILEIQLDADGYGGMLARVIGSGQPGLRDGSIREASFNHPHGLGLRDGALYVADTENHAVRAVDLANGTVRTLAGTGEKSHGRPALAEPLATPLRSPWAVLPLEQVLLIAMAGSHQIWVLTGEGQLGPFAGNGYEALVDGPVGESSFNQPSDLTYGMGHLFVADPEASAVRAISLIEEPKTITLVGQGLFDFGDQDGPADTALLQHPVGLDFYDGMLYIADTYNHKIKLLDPASGVVRTLIGDAQPGWQDGPFASARLFEPEGVVAAGGLLYIADTNNHQIRVAGLESGQVHTLRLRGLENMPRAPQERSVETLEPVTAAPGLVHLSLDLYLPQGFKRSPDAPAVIEVGGDHPRRLLFGAGEPVAFDLQVEQDVDIPLDITIYYCQVAQAQLCMINDRALLLPLRVRSGSPSRVQVPYRIPNQGE